MVKGHFVTSQKHAAQILHQADGSDCIGHASDLRVLVVFVVRVHQRDEGSREVAVRRHPQSAAVQLEPDLVVVVEELSAADERG